MLQGKFFSRQGTPFLKLTDEIHTTGCTSARAQFLPLGSVHIVSGLRMTSDTARVTSWETAFSHGIIRVIFLIYLKINHSMQFQKRSDEVIQSGLTLTGKRTGTSEVTSVYVSTTLFCQISHQIAISCATATTNISDSYAFSTTSNCSSSCNC